MNRGRPPCVHHWVLGEPYRGVIKGMCRRCGAQRSYPAGLQVPPAAPPEEEQAELDLPALAAAVSSLERRALI